LDIADGDGRTPLSHAAEEGYDEVAGLILAQDDVDADSRDEKGRTPLAPYGATQE
jgi:ankyrin repeat protein